MNRIQQIKLAKKLREMNSSFLIGLPDIVAYHLIHNAKTETARSRLVKLVEAIAREDEYRIAKYQVVKSKTIHDRIVNFIHSLWR